MKKQDLPTMPTFMLVEATSQATGELEALELVLAEGPDHFQAVQKGQHAGIRFRILMTRGQQRDLVTVLERAVDLPDHRPN